MKEDEVYRASKAWLVDNGFRLLAGQPPRGTDRLPVVEVKIRGAGVRGSLGSYKPDLIVANADVILIIECKPQRSSSDVEKLMKIRDDIRRQDALVAELEQRRLLERRGLRAAYPTADSIRAAFRYAIAYAGRPNPEHEVYSLVFNQANQSEAQIYLGLEPVVELP